MLIKANVRFGSLAPDHSSPGRPFVRYAPNRDRRRGNAAKAAKCQYVYPIGFEWRCK
jgi:hypothetical protein